MDAHRINLAFHIGFGAIGILIGLVILYRDKGTPAHRHLGWVFAIAALVVSLTATLGLIVFRFLPLFAVLTVLTCYQLLSGWRAVYLKERGPQPLDAALTAVATTTIVLLWPSLQGAGTDGSTRPVVVISTLAALGLILAYDSLRWLFPQRWHAHLWRYEHIYKLISAFAALTSALAGNVLRAGQPWSQIAPSFIGTVLIVYFFAQNARRSRARVEPTRDVTLRSAAQHGQTDHQ